jgi:hypothetical protein
MIQIKVISSSKKLQGGYGCISPSMIHNAFVNHGNRDVAVGYFCFFGWRILK